VRPLGAGGMAELFLARVDGIGGFAKLCALKRILPHKATNERFVRMLLNEARLVATLDHPNIAQVHDIGVEDGEYFFAMEYVHGHDLRRLLHEAPHHQLQLETTLHVAIGVCAGLHHAHEARDPSGRSYEIVHRDVNPSNVLVSYQGAVKLVDFGVAKAATVISETREGTIKGKFGYMSPEQCLGAPLDRRSDLFAVGILLWEMTVGRRLYKLSGDLATMQRVVYVDAPRPSRFVPGYPPGLERIVMRALARDPDKRYQTAEQIQLELEAFAVENKLAVSAVSTGQQMRQLFRDRIDAWHEAEQAGRSLADHLATLAPDVEIVTSDEAAAADLDGMIAQLGGGEATEITAQPFPDERTAETVTDKALSERAPPRTASTSAPPLNQPARMAPTASGQLPVTATVTRFEVPHPLVAPRPRRSRIVPIAIMFVVLVVFAGLWFLFAKSAN
jgi:serine/threonine protein kinase